MREVFLFDNYNDDVDGGDFNKRMMCHCVLTWY